MDETVRQKRFSLGWTGSSDDPDPEGSKATPRVGEHWKEIFFSHGKPDEPLTAEPGMYLSFVERLKGRRAFALESLVRYLRHAGSPLLPRSGEPTLGAILANVSASAELPLGPWAGLSSDPIIELRLENERLRTELIEKRREVLLLRQELARANRLQERLVDSACSLTGANTMVVHALTEKLGGRMCLSESLEGVVTRVLGEEIEITYETKDGPLRQVYHAAQFIRQKTPVEGEAIRTFAFIATGMASDASAAESEDEHPAEKDDFREWAESKPLIID